MVGWPLLALSGAVLAYILQLQTWITTIATDVNESVGHSEARRI